jgi:hypothetical protein
MTHASVCTKRYNPTIPITDSIFDCANKTYPTIYYQYIIKTDSIPTITTTTLFLLHSSIFIVFPWVLLGFLIPLFFRLFPCKRSMLLAFSLLVQLVHDDFNYFHCCFSFSYIYVPLTVFHYFFIFHSISIAFPKLWLKNRGPNKIHRLHGFPKVIVSDKV